MMMIIIITGNNDDKWKIPFGNQTLQAGTSSINGSLIGTIIELSNYLEIFQPCLYLPAIRIWG